MVSKNVPGMNTTALEGHCLFMYLKSFVNVIHWLA